MKRYLISFGSNGYENAVKRLAESAEPYFDKIFMCSEKTIDEFKYKHSLHFKESKGFGWWAWKPYLIHSVMIGDIAQSDMDTGDQIVYMDACMEFVKSPMGWLNYFNEDINLFTNGQFHHKYCKEYCYNRMGVQRNINQMQVNGAYQIYRKSKKSLAFLKEYMDYCLNLRCVNDDIEDPNEEHFEFISHRHDQSILTNLAIKHQIPIHSDITQFGSSDPIINHHRQK